MHFQFCLILFTGKDDYYFNFQYLLLRIDKRFIVIAHPTFCFNTKNESTLLPLWQ